MTADEFQPGETQHSAGRPPKRSVVPTAKTPRSLMLSMALVWVAAAIGVLLVAWLAPVQAHTAWLAMVFAGTVVLTFLIQLVLQRPKGFLHRATMSTVGALIVLAVGTLVLRLAAGSG